MEEELLSEIIMRTAILQQAHPRFFKNRITGNNTINLNFFLCYCIKAYDEKRGTRTLARWRRFINLSTGKLKSYNKLLRRMLVIFKRHYPFYLEKPQGEIDPEASIRHDLEWRYYPIEEGDIFVPRHKVLH